MIQGFGFFCQDEDGNDRDVGGNETLGHRQALDGAVDQNDENQDGPVDHERLAPMQRFVRIPAPAVEFFFAGVDAQDHDVDDACQVGNGVRPPHDENLEQKQGHGYDRPGIGQKSPESIVDFSVVRHLFEMNKSPFRA